jgi:hypothetical protein
MNNPDQGTPLRIKVIAWFGIALALTYLIWGIVSIILSMLDRSYKDLGDNIVIILYGVPVMAASIGFKSGHKWGWMMLFIVLLLVIGWSVMTFRDPYGLVWGVLATAAAVWMLMPSIRNQYFAR